MKTSSGTIVEIVQSIPLDARSADRLHAIALAGLIERDFSPACCGARVELQLTSPRARMQCWDVVVIAPDTSAGRELIGRLRAMQPLRLDFEAMRELTRLVIGQAKQVGTVELPPYAHAA